MAEGVKTNGWCLVAAAETPDGKAGLDAKGNKAFAEVDGVEWDGRVGLDVSDQAAVKRYHTEFAGLGLMDGDFPAGGVEIGQG